MFAWAVLASRDRAHCARTMQAALLVCGRSLVFCFFQSSGTVLSSRHTGHKFGCAFSARTCLPLLLVGFSTFISQSWCPSPKSSLACQWCEQLEVVVRPKIIITLSNCCSRAGKFQVSELWTRYLRDVGHAVQAVRMQCKVLYIGQLYFHLTLFCICRQTRYQPYGP